MRQKTIFISMGSVNVRLRLARPIELSNFVLEATLETCWMKPESSTMNSKSRLWMSSCLTSSPTPSSSLFNFTQTVSCRSIKLLPENIAWMKSARGSAQDGRANSTSSIQHSITKSISMEANMQFGNLESEGLDRKDVPKYLCTSALCGCGSERKHEQETSFEKFVSSTA
jgi:hypothetical protein